VVPNLVAVSSKLSIRIKMKPKKPKQSPNAGGERLDDSSAPFPTNTLPAPIAAMVRSVATVHGVPEVMPAVCALSAVSAALGKGLRISSIRGHRTMGNLYGVVSAASGSGKSSVLCAMLEPLYIIQDYLRTVHENQDMELPEQMDPTEGDGFDGFAGFVGLLPPPGRTVGAGSRARGKSGADKSPPQIICSEITGPALAKLLEANHETTLNTSAEAGNLLEEAGKTASPLGQLLLKGYSGDPVEIHRITREPVLLDGPCINICWLCQPHRLEKFLANDRLLEDGLVARFLVVHSKAGMSILPEDDITIPISVSDHYGALINQLYETYGGHPEKCLIVESNPEAREILKLYHNCCVVRCNSIEGALSSCITRWPEQAWKLALVLHAAAHGANAHQLPVDAHTAEDAVALQEWFAKQQMCILGGTTLQTETSRLKRLCDLLREAPDRELTLRVLENSHGFHQVEVQRLVELAPSHLNLQNRQNPRGGPRSPVLILIDNPPQPLT